MNMYIHIHEHIRVVHVHVYAGVQCSHARLVKPASHTSHGDRENGRPENSLQPTPYPHLPRGEGNGGLHLEQTAGKTPRDAEGSVLFAGTCTFTLT